ncbi:hypothetical protein [Streptomyces sp. NPDC059466]|uniref:hypothetical protein n=1 Tax=unclassified Streptomyces TaxID=2593676 RepID=UPI0036A42684
MLDRRVLAPALLAGALLVGSLAGCDVEGLHSGEHGRKFPHAGASELADVSLEQALADYGVHLPAAAGNVTYGALKALDGYPFSVEFSVPCDGVPGFARDNHLTSAGKQTPDAVRVQAVDAGFSLDSSPAYRRAKGSGLPAISGAVFERSGTCRVFLGS